jgi:hypothetical protein
MDNKDERESGDLFAIPDLYGPSELLTNNSVLPSFLFSQLKLDGLFSSIG